MKPIFLLTIFAAFTANVFAQKETFGAVTYKPIKGWKKECTDKSVSFSKTDEANGTFCIITICPSTEGTTDSKANFDLSWQKIVQEPFEAGSAKMEAAYLKNGWELQTGSTQFDKGGLAGIALLVTASSNNKMVNMLVLFNSAIYRTQLNDFIGSIELHKLNAATNNTSSTSNNNTSIAGIWTNNLLETSGYANGYAQYTAGYFRKEYTFKNDGTYFYSQKNWSAYSKIILYACETGTWSVSDNTITLLPTEGKAGEWNRTSNNKEWGSLIKTKNWKLEKTTYTYERKYYSGSQTTELLLNSGAATERDGTYKNESFSYTQKNEPLIDVPTRFKMGTEKPTAAAASLNVQQVASNRPTSNATASIAGKIYVGSSPEKTGSGNMQFNTGAF